jgi:hypothetical protein
VRGSEMADRTSPAAVPPRADAAQPSAKYIAESPSWDARAPHTHTRKAMGSGSRRSVVISQPWSWHRT